MEEAKNEEKIELEAIKNIKEDATSDTNKEDSTLNKYTKSVELPSRGYLGGPKSVIIRAMTASEEKILYSSRNFGFIEKIVRACTIEPKTLDMTKLYQADIVYLIYCIRELTFGSTYEQVITCPICNVKQDALINIADFEVIFLDKDIDSKLIIELPISKDKVHLKLINQAENDAINKNIERLVQNNKLTDPEGFEFIQRLIYSIDFIEGRDFDNESAKLSYVSNLHAMDANFIRNTINSLDFGLKNTCKVTCSNKQCESEIEVFGTFCPEFFRPTK